MATFIMFKIKRRYQKNGNSRTEYKKIMEENDAVDKVIFNYWIYCSSVHKYFSLFFSLSIEERVDVKQVIK